MSGWNSGWQQYPASKPIAVEGGLVTSKQRGKMADTWWSARFVDVLESYGLGGRMERGRRYARTGQVISLDVGPGELSAEVQGSRPAPYHVSVRLRRPTAAQWAVVDDLLCARVGYAAQLLAGEMPDDLEDAFAAAGVALFPRQWPELDARCSCPDWGDPCKHTAAVLYVFADRLDADPWLLLAWRGRTREQVLAPLRERVGGGAVDDRDRAGLPSWWPLAPAAADRVGSSPSAGVGTVAGDDVLVARPDPPDRVLARLEELDLDVRGVPLLTMLGPLYAAFTDGIGAGPDAG